MRRGKIALECELRRATCGLQLVLQMLGKETTTPHSPVIDMESLTTLVTGAVLHVEMATVTLSAVCACRC